MDKIKKKIKRPNKISVQGIFKLTTAMVSISAPSSWSSLVLVLVVAATALTASEAIRVPAVGNWTEELRGAAARRARQRHGWQSRRRAFENGLGRTPQMG